MRTLLERAVSRTTDIVVGKEREIRLALACLIARGHLLIEDLPGVGKTALAHVLATVLGLKFNRIQFTSDLLPADIVGVSVFERDSGTFRFHPGPVFAQVILADEINRATPKTQSALLEAMEEGQVTVDGATRALPRPFFVIATQNPAHQTGTFPLPESQLDRFLMRLTLGYPGQAAERALLKGGERRALIAALQPVLGADDLLRIQGEVETVHVAEAALDYLQALLEFSRSSAQYVTGLSPRAGLATLHAAKAWAYLAGRDHILPEDLQAVLPSVAGHRLRGNEHAAHEPVANLLSAVPVP
ncbi:MAG: AAA family ATPase [Pseudomonadota bacterium]